MIHTCIVGGWTEPRGSRPFFDSLLLGIVDEQGELRYVGRVSSGFADAQLGLIWKLLRGLKTKIAPFPAFPETVERPHWVKPRLAVQVRSSGWTKDGRLRRPVFAGLEADERRARAHNERHSVAADATRRD
jgi:bifunctional non-homologous end joining protein LigD